MSKGMKGQINYGHVESSERLQFFLAMCLLRGVMSTMEQQSLGRVTSASAARAELKMNGFFFDKSKKEENGKMVFYWSLSDESRDKAVEVLKKVEAARALKN